MSSYSRPILPQVATSVDESSGEQAQQQQQSRVVMSADEGGTAMDARGDPCNVGSNLGNYSTELSPPVYGEVVMDSDSSEVERYLDSRGVVPVD